MAYDADISESLQKMIPVQQKAGLNIKWLGSDEIMTLVPGINPAGLLGGTFSPEDGGASPMESCYAFQRNAEKHGAEFHFGETVISIIKNDAFTVVTDRGEYTAANIVNCAGSFGREVGAMAGMVRRVF